MKYFLELTIVLLMMQPVRVFSCGNEYESETYTYTKANGFSQNSEGSLNFYYFQHGFNIAELKVKKARFENIPDKKKSYKHLSDYALVLLKLGEYKQSLEILEDLIKKYPNEYNIVANLGTAYELNGQVDKALIYISKAVAINSESHEGSEWIHIKILEAKKQIQEHPLYLKENSILGLGVSVKGNYSEEDIKKFNKIKKELVWQLKERIGFVDSPDEIVADLLSDLGNLIAVTEYLETALPVYDLSLKYYPANLYQVLRHRDQVHEIIYWAKVKKYIQRGVLLILFLSGMIIAFRKIRKRRRNRKASAKPIPVFTSAIIEK
jgi:tetratricopeptide (TPR) repeat protein